MSSLFLFLAGVATGFLLRSLLAWLESDHRGMPPVPSEEDDGID